MNLESFKNTITDVPDFPKPGILFKDLTTSFSNPKAFQFLMDQLCAETPSEATHIVGIESRGFILSSAMALKLNLPLVLIRKPGKLPRPIYSHKYDLEYGQDELQIHKDDLSKDSKAIIVDDVLATGGTAQAAEALCQQTGAQVLKHFFVIEVEFLKGISRLKAPAFSLVKS